MANKVTADMTIYDVLCLDPENEKIAQVFFDMGMHCLGCPISRGETVAEALDIEDDGRLVCNIGGIKKKISSAEVSLRL